MRRVAQDFINGKGGEIPAFDVEGGNVNERIEALQGGLPLTALEDFNALRRRRACLLISDAFHSGVFAPFAEKTLPVADASRTCSLLGDLVVRLCNYNNDWHLICSGLPQLVSEALEVIHTLHPDAPAPLVTTDAFGEFMKQPWLYSAAWRHRHESNSQQQLLSTEELELPMTVYSFVLVSVLVYIDIPVYEDALKTLIWEMLLATLIYQHPEFADCTWARILANVVLQLQGETTPALVRVGCRIIQRINDIAPRAVASPLSEITRPQVPRCPEFMKCVRVWSEDVDPGARPGESEAGGCEERNGELLAKFFCEAFPQEDPVYYEAVSKCWVNELAAAIWDHCLNEIVVASETVDEDSAAQHVVDCGERLLVYTVLAVEQRVLQTLFVPLIELVKLCYWSCLKPPTYLVGFSKRVLTAVAMMYLQPVNVLFVRLAVTADGLFRTQQNDLNRSIRFPRQVFHPLLPLLDLCSGLASAVNMLKKASATNTGPSWTSSNFVCYRFVCEALATAGVTGSLVVASRNLTALVPFIAAHVSNELLYNEPAPNASVVTEMLRWLLALLQKALAHSQAAFAFRPRAPAGPLENSPLLTTATAADAHADLSPVDSPPAVLPPAVLPPASVSPVDVRRPDSPPALSPPALSPPAVSPPAVSPPAVSPPADALPADALPAEAAATCTEQVASPADEFHSDALQDDETNNPSAPAGASAAIFLPCASPPETAAIPPRAGVTNRATFKKTDRKRGTRRARKKQTLRTVEHNATEPFVDPERLDPERLNPERLDAKEDERDDEKEDEREAEREDEKEDEREDREDEREDERVSNQPGDELDTPAAPGHKPDEEAASKSDKEVGTRPWGSLPAGHTADDFGADDFGADDFGADESGRSDEDTLWAELVLGNASNQIADHVEFLNEKLTDERGVLWGCLQSDLQRLKELFRDRNTREGQDRNARCRKSAEGGHAAGESKESDGGGRCGLAGYEPVERTKVERTKVERTRMGLRKEQLYSLLPGRHLVEQVIYEYEQRILNEKWKRPDLDSCLEIAAAADWNTEEKREWYSLLLEVFVNDARVISLLAALEEREIQVGSDLWRFARWKHFDVPVGDVELRDWEVLVSWKFSIKIHPGVPVVAFPGACDASVDVAAAMELCASSEDPLSEWLASPQFAQILRDEKSLKHLPEPQNKLIPLLLSPSPDALAGLLALLIHPTWRSNVPPKDYRPEPQGNAIVSNHVPNAVRSSNAGALEELAVDDDTRLACLVGDSLHPWVARCLWVEALRKLRVEALSKLRAAETAGATAGATAGIHIQITGHAALRQGAKCEEDEVVLTIIAEYARLHMELYGSELYTATEYEEMSSAVMHLLLYKPCSRVLRAHLARVNLSCRERILNFK